MNINKSYRIGLRAIKTAIAVSICMLMSYITKMDDAFIAAFAAIICMQPTYNKTFNSGLNRIFGTVIGGIVGYILLKLFAFIPFYQLWWNVILAPASLLLVIYLCNMFNKQPSVSIGCIVLLCCVAQPMHGANDTLMYVVNRVLSTIFGILVAMFINKFLWPNKSSMDNKNLEKVGEVSSDCESFEKESSDLGEIITQGESEIDIPKL